MAEYRSVDYPYEKEKISKNLSDEDYMKEVDRRATLHIQGSNRSRLKTLSNDPFPVPPHDPKYYKKKKMSDKLMGKKK